MLFFRRFYVSCRLCSCFDIEQKIKNKKHHRLVSLQHLFLNIISLVVAGISCSRCFAAELSSILASKSFTCIVIVFNYMLCAVCWVIVNSEVTSGSAFVWQLYIPQLPDWHAVSQLGTIQIYLVVGTAIYILIILIQFSIWKYNLI